MDDPNTCFNPAERAERDWRAEVAQKLDEKLASLERCVSVGNVTRQERFFVDVRFSANGAWQSPASGVTTLPDCRAIECVGKQLSTMQVDAWTGEANRSVQFAFVLNPSSPPRRATANDPPFPFKDAKRCPDSPSKGGSTGRLPPDLIQQVVRTRYTEFKACYEDGLARNRTLEGKVMVRFVIERDGSVSRSSLYELTLPDCKVAACVRDAVRKLTFPAPEGGIVTVVYPIMLEPG